MTAGVDVDDQKLVVGRKTDRFGVRCRPGVQFELGHDPVRGRVGHRQFRVEASVENPPGDPFMVGGKDVLRDDVRVDGLRDWLQRRQLEPVSPSKIVGLLQRLIVGKTVSTADEIPNARHGITTPADGIRSVPLVPVQFLFHVANDHPLPVRRHFQSNGETAALIVRRNRAVLFQIENPQPVSDVDGQSSPVARPCERPKRHVRDGNHDRRLAGGLVDGNFVAIRPRHGQPAARQGETDGHKKARRLGRLPAEAFIRCRQSFHRTESRQRRLGAGFDVVQMDEQIVGARGRHGFAICGKARAAAAGGEMAVGQFFARRRVEQNGFTVEADDDELFPAVGKRRRRHRPHHVHARPNLPRARGPAIADRSSPQVGNHRAVPAVVNAEVIRRNHHPLAVRRKHDRRDLSPGRKLGASNHPFCSHLINSKFRVVTRAPTPDHRERIVVDQLHGRRDATGEKKSSDPTTGDGIPHRRILAPRGHPAAIRRSPEALNAPRSGEPIIPEPAHRVLRQRIRNRRPRRRCRPAARTREQHTCQQPGDNTADRPTIQNVGHAIYPPDADSSFDQPYSTPLQRSVDGSDLSRRSFLTEVDRCDK